MPLGDDDQVGARGRRPDPDQLQQWVLRDRVPAAEIGARLGLSRAAVYGWLHRYGIASGVEFLPQDRLVGLWRDGLHASRIAARTGISASAVRERLVAAAVLVPERSYFVVGSPEDPLPEHLLRDWVVRDGFTTAQVAALTGTTPRQVRYRLDRYRLSTGRPGPAPRLRRRLTRERLVGLYLEQGLSCTQIARREDVSAEAVRELLVAYGIERRPSGRRARQARVTPERGPQRPHRHQATIDRARVACARSAELIAAVRATMGKLAAV
ncbi:MAG: helix-turn-helix domain-containing protein [Actinomycetota bacterium]|nr:helix-turn-helix domain-containing protein [Actinomycetota bacterium]